MREDGGVSNDSVPQASSSPSDPRSGDTIEEWLQEILRCPSCRSVLTLVHLADGGAELECQGCPLAYPVQDGIPVLLVGEARQRA